VGSDPFDPDDCLHKIARHHKTIVITFDVENNPLRTDDARRHITTFYVRRILPSCLARFVKPGIQRSFDSRPILAGGKALDELSQRSAGDDPHSPLTSMVPLWEQEACVRSIALTLHNRRSEPFHPSR
jgi:hypothetical protein